ncbi:MAG: cupin domain-containing protein [Gammaproteobacteria bacterium]|nr:cupin domain-containing protein [Gammaproteobacteria bacterium]
MTEAVKILRFNDERLTEVIPGKFEFKHLHGTGATAALYKFKNAYDVPVQLNQHEEEITIILKGKCKLFIDGEEIILGEGDTIMIPPFKEHVGEFITDEVVLVSVFAPRRDDLGPEEAEEVKLSFLADQ